MDFKPLIPRDPILMDARIFGNEPMDLRSRLLDRPLTDRLALDADKDLFFVDLEHYSLRSQKDIDDIRQDRRVQDRDRSGAASTPSSITTISRSCRNCWIPIRTWSGD